MSLWYWVAIALLLGIAELFTGTAYLLGLGIAAFFTASVSALFPGISLLAQASLFAFLAIASTGLWFMRNQYRIRKTAERPLNQKARALIGRKVTLTEDMHDYCGHIMLDGVLWRIKAAENYSAHTVVEIKGVESTILVVHTHSS